MTQVSMGGDDYVIPAEARPFVGSLLDKSLFDVTALAAQSPAGTASAPITATLAPGSTATIPGLTVTARTRSTVSGTFDAAGASTFRGALARAAVAGLGPRRQPLATLFRGIDAISAANDPAGPTAHPNFAQLSLNVDVLDDAGKPVPFNVIELVNMDDSRRYFDYVAVDNGSARISVPAGNYTAMTQVDDYDGDTLVATRVVVVADFAVTRDLETLTLDARTATVNPTVTTPRTSALQRNIVEVDREPVVDGAGPLTFYTTTDPSYELYVSPTPKVRVGTLYFANDFRAANPTTSTVQYSYDLVFENHGMIPSNQHRNVVASQLGQIDARYFAVSPHAALLQRSPLFAFGDNFSDVPLPFNVPGTRTEYTLAPAGTQWQDVFIGTSSDENPYGSFVEDGVRTHSAGVVSRVDWLRGPLGGGVQEGVLGDDTYYCGACRTASSMTLTMADVKDTVIGHSGYVYPANDAFVSYFALKRDGVVLTAGENLFGGTATVPTAGTTYSVELDVDRTADGVKNSSDSQTTLTFPSSASGGLPIPEGWRCDITPASKCRVLPILTDRVDLPTNLNYELPVGHTTFPVKIGRMAGAGTVNITSALVTTSIDGQHFVPASMHKVSNGVYDVTVSNSASWAGKYVFMHVEGIAADGATIEQNVTNAYRVSPAN